MLVAQLVAAAGLLVSPAMSACLNLSEQCAEESASTAESFGAVVRSSECVRCQTVVRYRSSLHELSPASSRCVARSGVGIVHPPLAVHLIGSGICCLC